MSEASNIVTGNIVSKNEGWEARAEDLCDPANFEVEIRPTPELFAQLTGSEIARLQPKLRIVARSAKFQAAGMLKGTIKYPSDNYDRETWFKYLLGEGADFQNYIGLTLGVPERN